MKVPATIAHVLALARFATIASALSLLIAIPAQGARLSAPGEDIFHGTNLLRIAIEIPPDGVEQLQQSSGGRRTRGKPQVQARVIEDGNSYTNVGVQLKGYSSFRSIDSLPSLTLDFNKHVPKQKFHGLTKVSLNNSLQDPSRLHEKLTREMFAAANVPVARSDFALLTLNGRELGLYVLAEGLDKRFLGQHFPRTDGTLYEGGILRDIDSPLQIGAGRFATDDLRIQKLISISREPNHATRLQELDRILDVDRFLSMVAIETLFCHSDSYSMNRNNYRLYDDPTSGKFVFIPHGMDRVLGAHRSQVDLSVVPPALGLVARAILLTDEGRARYVDRAGTLFTNLFVPETLCRRLHEIDARIAKARKNIGNANGLPDQRVNHISSDEANDMCRTISARAAHLSAQFANRADLLKPAPTPSFDSNGIALIERWQLKLTPDQAKTTCTLEDKDGKPVWHVRVSDSQKSVTLRAPITMPGGSYRLTGQIKCWDSAPMTNAVQLTFLSNSTQRYAVEQRRLNPRQIALDFQIVEPRVPDEVELSCDIHIKESEFWLDASSLRLVKFPDYSVQRQ